MARPSCSQCYWLSLLCAYMARPSCSLCYWLGLLCAYMARPSSSQLLLVGSAVCVHGPTVLQSVVTGWVCYVRTWPDRPPVSCYWLSLLCAYMARPSSSQLLLVECAMCVHGPTVLQSVLLVGSAMCVHGPTVLQSAVTGWVCYVRTWPDHPPVSCYWLSLLCAYMARPSSSQLLLVGSAMCVHGPTILQSAVTGWVCCVRTWPDHPPVSCYWLGLLCAYMARPSSSQCYWLGLLCAYMARPSCSQCYWLGLLCAYMARPSCSQCYWLGLLCAYMARPSSSQLLLVGSAMCVHGPTILQSVLLVGSAVCVHGPTVLQSVVTGWVCCVRTWPDRPPVSVTGWVCCVRTWPDRPPVSCYWLGLLCAYMARPSSSQLLLVGSAMYVHGPTVLQSVLLVESAMCVHGPTVLQSVVTG